MRVRSKSKLKTLFKWSFLTIITLLIIVITCVIFLLRGSLPKLNGNIDIAGLQAPVSIQRDKQGTVTIDAQNEADALRALGYVHAQERYFEMDLMRRTSAGELSELFGARAVNVDKKHRIHRLRQRINENLDAFYAGKKSALDAYTEGVNTGLAELTVRPWPYLLLQQEPKTWTNVDSALTGYAMYFDLQDSQNQRELSLFQLQEHVPAALYQLINHGGSRWDAPLSGEITGDAILPSAEQLNLRELPTTPRLGVNTPSYSEPYIFGSNNFAVSGKVTDNGRAIVADDMHLGLRAPNIWFRARLRYPDALASNGKVDVSGFTLPGLPAMVVGSNRHIAWGFTNSYIDNADWAVLSLNSDDDKKQNNYQTYNEKINIAGEPAVDFLIEETNWGPILHKEKNGSALALRWTAQLPGALRLSLMDFVVTDNLEIALKVGDSVAIPAQNLMLGDKQGNIAWRILGTRPDRKPECSPEQQVNDLSVCPPWNFRTDSPPQIINPENHRLWTANSRVVNKNDLVTVGDSGYDLAARAHQIKQGLEAKTLFNENDIFNIQLDNRAVLLQEWLTILEKVTANNPQLALAKPDSISANTPLLASVDSIDYRKARVFREYVSTRIRDALLAPVKAKLGEAFIPPRMSQLEGVVWPLITQQPMHLLPANYSSWDELLTEAAQQLNNDIQKEKEKNQLFTWGERNTAAICHPLASASPVLKNWLCMPAQPLAGDSNMPRVTAPDFGASQRMVVAPGYEEQGIIQMPGGQSGHFLSPFWGAGHNDWVEGKSSAFLPGNTEYTLHLNPKK